MANEAINPYQTFRNAKGVPLSAGKLRIRVPGTSTLGTAFSDDDLTVSQVVNPYVLDMFGRVVGDLKWAGTRDVEVYDANDAFIRTDPNVVTLIDSSSFAINVASVAAMIALTTLVVGDVVETQSYTAAQGDGGARYLIVATATGTDDGYTFHDLDNGLQGQLIDIERNNNFYVAGAVGDGVADDSVPVQRLLTVGGDIECANGSFPIASLTLSKSARIHGNGTLLRVAMSGVDMVTLSGTDLLIVFDGITLDGNLANQVAAQTIAMITSSVTATAATTFSKIAFNEVQFQNGSQYDVFGDGNDNGFPLLYQFSGCNFIGGEQGTDTFDVASVAIQDGANASFEDCYWNLVATPTTGRPAIEGQATGALTNPGWLSVTACTIQNMGMELTALADSRGAIDARDMAKVIIDGNRILTPQAGGIVFGAEVDVVSIQGNLVDALATSLVAFGGIAAVATARAAPGDNWQIDNNELIAIADVAINLDGTSAGVDASQVQITGNVIDSPAAQAILVHNLDGVAIRNNQIDMAVAAGINAVEVNTDGVTGLVSISGNGIINVNAAAIINAVTSTGAIFHVDGNTIEAAVDGIDIQDALDALINNNVLVAVTGDLITVGTLTNAYIDGNINTGTAPTGTIIDAGSVTTLVTGENFVTAEDSSLETITIVGAGQTISVTSKYHLIHADLAASIGTINFPGAMIGRVVVFQIDATSATITFNDAAGNLNLVANRALDTLADTLALVFDSTGWKEVCFANNA